MVQLFLSKSRDRTIRKSSNATFVYYFTANSFIQTNAVDAIVFVIVLSFQLGPYFTASLFRIDIQFRKATWINYETAW